MTARLERLLALIQGTVGDGRLAVPMRVCLVCPSAVGVDGAGVSLISTEGFLPLAASDHLSDHVEQLQASVGEGPCYDAVSAAAPVLATDLSSDDNRDRWPEFTRSALDAGVRAVFGFPLTFDGVAVGALDMYSRTRCALSDGDIKDALILAGLTAIAVHDLSDRGRITEVGLSSGLDEPWAHQSVVHHATGMTAVHLGIGVDEAILRLRAHAFASSRSLAEMSADIVAGRMRLEKWDVDE